MAKKITETLIDDLDGTPLENEGETVRFGLDGISYEIDLSAAHAADLREAFSPYVTSGRKASTTEARARRTGRARSTNLSGVRAWLREQGHTVPDRGRIPRQLQEEYDAAHSN